MTAGRGESSEDELLRWLRQELTPSDLLGDDAAILPATGPYAITVDSQIEGVHFLPGTAPAVVARRLLAVNLSDVAAMGALPRHAFLALTAPPSHSPAPFDYRAFFRAFLEEAGRFGVELAGGDLARGPTGLAATLTLTGELPAGHRWLRRRDATAGETIWVGGTLGESAAGRLLLMAAESGKHGAQDPPVAGQQAGPLADTAANAIRRHLHPGANLELGLTLSRTSRPAGAAMDLSDGLVTDLPRLCEESGCGAEIDLDRLPFSPGLTEICAELGEDPLRLALAGGEDYVLLFTLAPGTEASPWLERGCHPIGRVIAGHGVAWLRGGEPEAVEARGWDHLRADLP